MIDQKPQHNQIQEPLFTLSLLLKFGQSHEFCHGILLIRHTLSGHNILNRQFQQMGQRLQDADIRETFPVLPPGYRLVGHP